MAAGSFEVVVEKGRQVSFNIAVFGDDESTETVLASADLVRFKAGRRPGATPDIELNSADDSTQLTFTASSNDVVVTLVPGDTSGLNIGTYSAELLIIDESASDAVLSVEQGVLHVVPTLGGSVADV